MSNVISKGRNRRQKQKRKPDTVVASFYPLGNVPWEVESLEDGDLTPKVMARFVAAGDKIKKRLQASAELLTKLRTLGWNGLGDLEWLTLSKETTREEAVREFASLHIDPESITLQEVATDEDYGWIEVGEEFTIPKRAMKEISSIPAEDRSRMKTELDLMRKALRKERKRNKKLRGRRKHGKRVDSAEAREEKLVKHNDILMNALQIVSTFLEETLAQPDIRRLD